MLLSNTQHREKHKQQLMELMAKNCWNKPSMSTMPLSEPHQTKEDNTTKVLQVVTVADKVVLVVADDEEGVEVLKLKRTSQRKRRVETVMGIKTWMSE
jgi:hypothetical protein